MSCACVFINRENLETKNKKNLVPSNKDFGMCESVCVRKERMRALCRGVY